MNKFGNRSNAENFSNGVFAGWSDTVEFAVNCAACSELDSGGSQICGLHCVSMTLHYA